MAQSILLKRSSVAGNVPDSSDLSLGEIAINTADGAVYIKKGNNDIVAVHDNDILHIDTANGRIGINKQSPGYRLDIDGNMRATAAYINGYIYHTGDTDTYINYSTDNIIFSAGGEVMHIKGSGKVGIGTSTPSKTFEISYSNNDTNVGGNALSGGGSGSGFLIRNTNTTAGIYANLDFRANNADGRISYKYNSVNDGDFHFITDNNDSVATKMIIKNTGNVGIGHTAPPDLLTIMGDGKYIASHDGTNYAFKLGADSSGDGNFMLHDSSGNVKVKLYAESGSHNYIQNGGSFGLGTSSPSYNLHVNGTGDTIAAVTAGASSVAGLNLGNSTNLADGGIRYDNSSDKLIFRAGNATKAEISSTGALTLNSAYTFPTSDGSANQVLQTDGSGNLSFATVSGGGGSTDSITDADGDTKIQVEENTDEDQIRFDAASIERMRIGSDVQIIGTTDFNITGTSRRLNFTAGSGTVRTTTANSLILATNNTTALTINSSQEATFSSNVSTLGGVTVGDSSADVLRFVGLLKHGSGSGTTIVNSNRQLESLSVYTYGSLNLPTVTSTVGTYLAGSNTSSIINHPISSDVWHDVFAFRRNGGWTYETSTDGSSFSSATISENPFDHKDTTGVNILTSTIKAARWTVSGLQYATIKYFSIAAHYVASGISVKFKVETSSDGSSWTTRVAETTFTPNTYHHFFRTSGDHGGHGYIRITLTKDNLSSSTNVDICRLCAWSNRPGDQGQGKEQHYPFDYVHRTSVDFKDNQRLRLGTSQDLELYHNATDSKLENYTGNLYITNEAQDKDVILSTDNGSGSITPYITLDGSAEKVILSKTTKMGDNIELQLGNDNDFVLKHNATNSVIQNATGDLIVDAANDIVLDADGGDIILKDNGVQFAKFTQLIGALAIGAGTGTDIPMMISSTKTLFFKDVQLGDDEKLIFGDGEFGNMQLFHDGTDSFIDDMAEGNLVLRTNGSSVKMMAGSENMVVATKDGGVSLYYDNTAKLETTTSGIDVSGQVHINDYVVHNGDSNTYLGFTSADTFDLVTGGTTAISADANAAYLRYQGSAKLSTAADGIILTSTDATNAAGPVLDFNRDSASPADADYLGQLKFRGENDADQDIVFAKITAKAADVSDGTEDGAIEFTVKKAGSNNINARLSANNLDLINGTGLSVAGNATITGNLTVNGSTTTLNTATLDVEDKNITLNKGSGDTSGSANGAGITIQDAVDASTDATILWNSSSDGFEFSHDVNVAGMITATGNNHTFYSGAGSMNASFGRNENERLQIYVQDSTVTLTADQDSDGNGQHDFILDRTFEGTGANNFRIRKSGSDQLVIDTNGNVGIGTSSPDEKLEVAGGVASKFYAFNAVNNLTPSDSVYISAPRSSNLGLFTASTERVTVDGSGKVGIGTSSPGALLNANSSSTIGWSNLANAHILAGTTTGGIGIDTNEIASKGDHIYFGTIDAKDIVFRTAGANERMKIASNGNVSIGAPSAQNGTLHVNGTFRIGPYYSANDRDGFLMIPHGTDTRLQSNNERFHIENNQGNILITASGVVQIGTYAVDTTSTSSSATTQIAIHTFAAATFRSARFTVQVTNSTDSTYHTTELLLVHDGTTANITEFGEIHTGSAVEATFDCDVNSGNVRLLATPASTDTMAFKVVCHSITT